MQPDHRCVNWLPAVKNSDEVSIGELRVDSPPVINVTMPQLDGSALYTKEAKLAQFDIATNHWFIHAASKDNHIKSAIAEEGLKSDGGRGEETKNDSQTMQLSINDVNVRSGKEPKIDVLMPADSNQILERRPPIVYVDSPARIERDTNDPNYTASLRKYQATATIARTSSNRYWASWRADNKTAGEGPGNFAVIAFSDDKNKTFKEYGYLTYSPEHAGNQIVDPMLWTDPDGRLWLFYGVMGNNQHYDGIGGSWAVICDNPNDKNPVWGKPFRLSYYGVPRLPVQVNDAWYVAIDGWRFSAEEPPMYMDHVGPHIYKLDWKKRHVSHVAQLPPNNKGQYSGFFETEFVERKDGAVAALLRWQGKNSQILFSVSKDGMHTWTPWQDYKVIAPSSSSRVWLGRSPSGRMVICWNNDTVRRTLTIGLSEDEGRSWKYKQVIEPNEAIQVSYPVVTFGDDGDIFAIYDSGRDTNRQIRVSKVNETEIISGSSMPEVTIISDPEKH